VGIVGPRTRSSNGDIQVSSGDDLSLASEWRQRRLVLGVLRRDARARAEAEARHATEHEPGWVSGACLLARREAFEAVSGFDERFFLYEEDADLCRRVRAAGWQVVFTPEAEVGHARGRSMARTPARARLEYQRSHLLYYRKHCGLLQRVVLHLLLTARALADVGAGAVSGDIARCREGAALLRLSLLGRSAT
jgi:GT2 family glycosyltransferase